MTKVKFNAPIATFLAIVVSLLAIISTSIAQAQSDCNLYSVNVPILQVLEAPDKPGSYVSVLQSGDTACVADQSTVGPQKLALVVEKSADGGAPEPVNGWASLIFLSPVPEAANGDSAAAATEPSSQQATDQMAVFSDDEVLKFTQPVPYGAPQVRGKTLAELIEGKPMFAPIEGLQAELWQKTCTSCHNWNAERLCDQGLSYIPRASEIFRHQHPYGGAYKLSLMRWAKTGCEN